MSLYSATNTSIITLAQNMIIQKSRIITSLSIYKIITLKIYKT